MNGDTIYHLEFTSGSHHYFGSIAAIFEVFDPKTLEIAQQSLYDFGITKDRPYKNKVCIVRKDKLIRKKGKRGKRKISKFE